MPYGVTTFSTFTIRHFFHRTSSCVHTLTNHIYTWLWAGNNSSVWLLFLQIPFPTDTTHRHHRHMPLRQQNSQELAAYFICWVTSAWPAERRKVRAVCEDDYCNHWAKDVHIKDRLKVWCHMASLGWIGLTCVRVGLVNKAYFSDV